MKNQQPGIYTSFTLCMIFAVLASCSPTKNPDTSEQTDIFTVERGTIDTFITATGSVYPQKQVTLSFDVGGRLSELYMSVGDTVRKGDLLAKLDTADLELQIRSAEAGLIAAQAQLSQLEEGPLPEEIAIAEKQLAAAQAAVSQAEATRAQLLAGAREAEIASAEARVAAALAEQKAAQNIHDRTMQCQTATMPDGSEQKFCPGLGYTEEEARFNLNAANQSLAAAQAQLDAVQRGSTSQYRNADAVVSGAVAQRDIVLAQLDLLKAKPSEATITAAKASITQAEIALDAAKLALQRAYLRSPIDGVIAEITVNPAEFVIPQVPVIVIKDNASFEVRGDIDESDIGVLTQGTEVTLSFDAYPEHKLTGHITAIAQSATLDVGIVTYEVTIAIDDLDVTLRDGMTANMEILRQKRENVLVVPNLAIWIDSDTGRQFVEKQVGEDVEYVYVEQGISNDQLSEIISGLAEGDTLVIRSSSVRERFRQLMTASMTGGSE